MTTPKKTKLEIATELHNKVLNGMKKMPVGWKKLIDSLTVNDAFTDDFRQIVMMYTDNMDTTTYVYGESYYKEFTPECLRLFELSQNDELKKLILEQYGGVVVRALSSLIHTAIEEGKPALSAELIKHINVPNLIEYIQKIEGSWEPNFDLFLCRLPDIVEFSTKQYLEDSQLYTEIEENDYRLLDTLFISNLFICTAQYLNKGHTLSNEAVASIICLNFYELVGGITEFDKNTIRLLSSNVTKELNNKKLETFIETNKSLGRIPDISEWKNLLDTTAFDNKYTIDDLSL